MLKMSLTATQVLKSLHGVVCIYKPPETSLKFIELLIRKKLCADLNSLKTRPPAPYVQLEGDRPENFSITVQPSFADNVMVVGPRVQEQDFSIKFANYLGTKASGVVVAGINSGIKTADRLRFLQPTSVFQIKAQLGQAHYTLWPDSKVKGKATYDHVRKEVLDKILASIQAAHQKQNYIQCGYDIHTQECYELAVKGLLRPVERIIPAIYGIKCIAFEPPDFTMEIQCVNINEQYLLQLAYSIGLRLKSLATCTGIRCIRYGCFTVKESLLTKHIKVDEIISNMEVCDKLLEENYKEFNSNLEATENIR